MPVSPPFQKEWGALALRYMKYRLNYLNRCPALNNRLPTAEDLSRETGVSPREIERFRSAILDRSIGASFPRERAENIAVAWCLVNKRRYESEVEPDREREQEMIRITAFRIGVDPEQALEFNDFLESLYED